MILQHGMNKQEH